MVNKSVAAVLCLLACACSGKEPVILEKAHESQAILAITISKNAAWSDNVSSEETVEECKSFHLTETDVWQFFELARAASEREFDHELIMSRCFSKGTISLRNEVKGTWFIDRARRGAITYPDGETSYFYCDGCTPSVFMEPCDIDCVHE